MQTINQFFNSLDKKIKNAKTLRALKILKRRGNKYISKLKNSEEKDVANKRFDKSKQLIEIRKVQIS